MALNMINPGRKYHQRQKKLKTALAWWEDEIQNPDTEPYINTARRKIIFEDLPYRLNSLRRASDISISGSRQWPIDTDPETKSIGRILPSRMVRRWRPLGRVVDV